MDIKGVSWFQHNKFVNFKHISNILSNSCSSLIPWKACDFEFLEKVEQHTHYSDVIVGTIASQITSLTIVYSTVYSDTDQRKYQSSASLAFVREFTGDRWIPRTNGLWRGKCFHLMTSSYHWLQNQLRTLPLPGALLSNVSTGHLKNNLILLASPLFDHLFVCAHTQNVCNVNNSALFKVFWATFY